MRDSRCFQGRLVGLGCSRRAVSTWVDGDQGRAGPLSVSRLGWVVGWMDEWMDGQINCAFVLVRPWLAVPLCAVVASEGLKMVVFPVGEG